MKKRGKSQALVILLVLASLALALVAYPYMPLKMASHWNIKGEVSGYLPRFWGLFLMPLISAFIVILFTFLPRIDPLKQNVAKFRQDFDNFILLVLVFLFYLYLLTISWNLGYRYDFVQALLPALAVLFYYSGVLIGKAKRNWFIGIKTPWTLSSDQVWDKTHRLGGKLFKLCGLITLLGLFFPQIAFVLALLPVLLCSFFLFFYSYFQFRNLSA